MNASQIAQVAAQAGFPASAIPIAVAIALAESSGNPGARCSNCLGASEDSRGLWQINVKAHPQYAAVNLYDPLTNAQAALAVSGGGSNWSPWTTFKTGAYRKFLASGGGSSSGAAATGSPDDASSSNFLESLLPVGESGSPSPALIVAGLVLLWLILK